MLNLEAKTNSEKLILKYLEENASEILKEKINAGEKTLKDCWEFIRGEARKKAVNGCACIDDQTVFGWAIHFFEEDGITVSVKKGRGPERPDDEEEEEEAPKKVVKAAPAKKKTDTLSESQMAFDF